MKPQFLNSPEDCRWLRETALKNNSFLPFNSFILHGNEDCPEKLELFAAKNPSVEAKCVTVEYDPETDKYIPA